MLSPFFWILFLFFSLPLFAAKPCEKAPKGMACILGGNFERGDVLNHDKKAKGFSLSISTFYLDQYEVSNKEYKACVDSGYCYHPYAYLQRGILSNAKLPATFVSWYEAQKFCHWQGKELPTEMQWEFAAKTSQNHAYSWGNDAASCKKAHYKGCNPRRPRNVFQGKANPNQIFNLSGNVEEWVKDWYTPFYKQCDKDCFGQDPAGICKGSEGCGWASSRVVKGGSYRTHAKDLQNSVRRGLNPFDVREKFLGFRCASWTATLQKPKPLTQLSTPREKKTIPSEKLSDALHKEFWGTPEDNLEEKKLCPVRFRSGGNCRDPISYVKSNEQQAYLFKPYIENLGGAYIGIGADQNYNFIAWARSQVAWLMDYDPIIPLIHKIHRAFVLNSKTGKEFFQKWKPQEAKKSMELLRKVYEKDSQKTRIVRAFHAYKGTIYRHFLREFSRKNPEKFQFWAVIPEHFQTIQTLFRLDRIRMMPGDLLKFKSLDGAGKMAKKLGWKVKVMYFSNAEEYWFYPPHFRKYIQQIPLDEDSMVVRTLSHPRWGSKKLTYFHYNVQHAKSFQKMLQWKMKDGFKGYLFRNVKDLMMAKRMRGAKENITHCDMPRQP